MTSHPETSQKFIQDSIRRMILFTGLPVGGSTLFYILLTVFFNQWLGWRGLGQLDTLAGDVFKLAALASCVAAIPLACAVEWILAARVKAIYADPEKRAVNLAAVGMVALTLVHLPSVMALTYYLISGKMNMALIIQALAFIEYLVIQWIAVREIRAASE